MAPEGGSERRRLTMRFDPGKAWPHPVLRPPIYGDDYPQAEFEVEIEVERALGSTSVEVTVEFELSDSDLLQLVGGRSRAVCRTNQGVTNPFPRDNVVRRTAR